MAELFPTIESNGFQNWLKAALALLFAKQGLQGFVCEEVTQFQNDLLLAICAEKSLPSGTICNECTTENVLPCPTPNFCPTGRCKLHDNNKSDKKPYRQCRSSICQEIQKVIQREHRYNKPSWKNTNATRWCTDAFEIAKCYMPPDGYAAVATLEYTDFSGTLAVIINNKRFQNKMAAKLHQQNNICIQAREVGRRIRHSADFAVSDPELIKYIETLINLLSDTKHLAVDQKAREAVDKLNLLKSKALTVTTSDITTVLDDALKAIVAKQCDDALQDISAEKDKAQAEIDEKMGALVKLLEGVKASIANMPTVATSSLDEIIATKVSALNELNRATESSLATLETKGKQIQEELRKEFGIQRQTRSLYLTDRKELETCMRDDLIEFYRKYHNTILVAPLVEELDVPLCEFYVQPPLTSLNVRKMYGISKQHTKTPVNSYHDLFFHGDDNIYQHIFVKANAGVGKTSFAKRICMTWCQAHNPVESLKTKFKQEDVDALGKYDLLFLLSLRNQDPSECDIDNMICSGVLRELAKSSSYTMHALQDVLCTSTCLVVLDGLDEWSHPANCTRGRPDDLPHIPARKQCSVLMTTRPWKLDVANPRMSQIDKIVEINELDTSLSEQLITNAITVLNNQAVTNQSKTTEEFQKATSTLKLGTMRYIPYILLQMVCLWFDGKSIGNSKCEIYGNMIKLTLSRWLQKKELPPLKRQDLSNPVTIPSCLLSYTRPHSEVMLGLAKLAFETLFSLNIESRLIFEQSVVLDNMEENTLALCLEMGFLSQNKDYESVSSKRSNFSYQHKSIQEFFAALHIKSCSEKQNIRKNILQVCRTLPTILDMSNVFIFLGGFSPVTCWEILQILYCTIESDETTREFRGSIQSQIWPFAKYHKNVEFIMARFQNMMTDISQEIKGNCLPVGVEDIFINEHYDERSFILLKSLIDNSRDNIKSLSIERHESAEQLTKILETLGLQNVKSLHKLVIEASLKEGDLNQLLSGSDHTLTGLILQRKRLNDDKYLPVSPESTAIINNMDNLKSLSLKTVCLTHSDIKILFEHLGKTSTMVEIALGNILCKDHRNECTGHCINLSQHQKLKLLKLETVPVSELRVYSFSLETCLLGNLPQAVHSAAARCLIDASNLCALRIYGAMWQSSMQEILPTWVHLKSLFIMHLDLGDEAFILPCEMLNIEEVRFSCITMSERALRRLIQSIDDLPQPVTFKLHKCNVTPLHEHNQIKDEIRLSSKYQILADEDDYYKYITLK